MDKLGGRKLKHEALEAIRIRAVQAVQFGKSPEDVVAVLGMTRGCICKWLAAFNTGGIDSLRGKKLFGRPTKLTAQQISWVYKTVVGKNPLQLKFEFALWTREMNRTIIKQRYGIGYCGYRNPHQTK